MSEYARDGVNCNGGLLVSVTPADYPKSYAGASNDSAQLSGIAFQRALEKSAFMHGGGDYHAPAQRVADFLARRPSRDAFQPSIKAASVTPLLSARRPLVQSVGRPAGIRLPCNRRSAAANGKSIRGFSSPDAVLTAVETRSSSPVRIDRENYEAAGLKGLFPCGEGSGYAGGIMSAAVDGIRAAEAFCAVIA